jgi:hypothetical protein
MPVTVVVAVAVVVAVLVLVLVTVGPAFGGKVTFSVAVAVLKAVWITGLPLTKTVLSAVMVDVTNSNWTGGTAGSVDDSAGSGDGDGIVKTVPST